MVNINSCHEHPQFANVTRSKSKTTAILDPNKQAPKSKLALLNLSKSKSSKSEESTLISSRRNGRKKLLQESRDDSSAKLLQRSQSKIEVPRGTRSATTSPSAWALSPGRSLHPSPMPQPFSIPKSKTEQHSCSTTAKSSGGVSGVFKYFSKKKKVSSLQEEEYHQIRVMHNRLLQWRFVNARAQVSMTALKTIAQNKLFNVWLKTSILRNLIVEKRIQLQKLKRVIKLYDILSSEINLLHQWARLESKNCESVGRLARKLSAISVCLPLDQDSKADVTSFNEAMSMAKEVMGNIEEMIANIQAQGEQTCYMLTELSVIVKEERDYANQLQKSFATVTSLVAQERSLRIHSIQLDEESRRVNSVNSHPQ